MRDYTFITGNDNKAREFSEIVGMDIPHQKVDVPEIQSLDLEEVATAKARAAFDILKKPVIVEDVSFVLDAMSGLPGPFVKFFLSTVGTKGLIDMVNGFGNRKADASVCYVLHDGRDTKVFTKTVQGTIAETEAGENGFGFDTIFIPDGHDRTFAQMDAVEKNQISMRREPIEKIGEFLKHNS